MKSDFEQIYSWLALIFAVLVFLTFAYLVSQMPISLRNIDPFNLSPQGLVRWIQIFAIGGVTTSVLSIMNREKTSWVKVLGIILNGIILAFFVVGIVTMLIFWLLI